LGRDIISVNCILSEKNKGEAYIHFMPLSGISIPLPYRPDEPISALKYRYQEISGICASEQRIIFGGKQLEEGRTLNDYYIQEGSTLHLLTRLRGGMFHVTSGLEDYNAVKGYITDISKLDVLITNLKTRFRKEPKSLDKFLSEFDEKMIK
jgi:hypothetical protein